MILKRVINLFLIILPVNILTSCLRDGSGERSPQRVVLYAPQYLNSPKIKVGPGEPIVDGHPYIKLFFEETSKQDDRPDDAGGRRELEYSESKTKQNEILNSLGYVLVANMYPLMFYDVTSAGSPVLYADAEVYGRAPGEDLSDILYNFDATIRVTGDYHLDGYFSGSKITLKDWLKEGDLIYANCAYFQFLSSPPESLEGVTFTLEIPVRYAAPWPEYRGSVPYPDNPETTIVCSATMPVSE